MVKIAGNFTHIALFVCLSLSSLFGQSNPAPCSLYPVDYQYVDNSVLMGIDDYSCEFNVRKEIKLNPNASIGGGIQNAKVFFNPDQTFDFSGTGGADISYTNGVAKTFLKGITWVTLIGELGGQKIVTCKSYEFFDTTLPVISSDLCSGNPINLSIADAASRDKFRIDWGDGKTEVISRNGLSTITNHTYTDFYSQIKVQAFYERDNKEVCASGFAVKKRDVPEPVFLSLLTGLNDATEVYIKYLGNQDIEYVIEGTEDNNGALNNWTEMSRGEAGEGTIIGLNPQQKYCFRIRMENSCGEHFYSENTLCNIVINRDVVSRSSMKLSWNMPRFPEVLPQESKLDKREVSGLGVVNSTKKFSDPSTLEFLDENLNCGQEYYYLVENTYPAQKFNGNDVRPVIRTSYISKKISEAKVNAKPPYMAIASFDPLDDSMAEFTVAIDAADVGMIDKFIYFKAEQQDGNYTEVNQSASNKFTENGLVQKSVCFKYQVLDGCGVLTSLSDAFCTIKLEDIKNDSLKWTPFKAPRDVYFPGTPPLYIVEYFDEAQNSFRDLTTILEDSATFVKQFLVNQSEPELKFRILMNQNVKMGGIPNFPINLYSNTIKYTIPPIIQIPTVFTPNGSGPYESENFRLVTKFVKSGSFKVLDRFGNVLFAGSKIDDVWDGNDQRHGKPVPLGTYFYSVSAMSYDDKPITLKGSVSILK